MTEDIHLKFSEGSYIAAIRDMRAWEASDDKSDLIIKFYDPNGNVAFCLKYAKPNYACVGFANKDYGLFQRIGYGYPIHSIKDLSQHQLRNFLISGVNPGGTNTKFHDATLSHFIAMTSEAARFRLVAAQYVLVYFGYEHSVSFQKLHKHFFNKFGDIKSIANVFRNDPSSDISAVDPLTYFDVKEHAMKVGKYTKEMKAVIKKHYDDMRKADAILQLKGLGGLAQVYGHLLSKTAKHMSRQAKNYPEIFGLVPGEESTS